MDLAIKLEKERVMKLRYRNSIRMKIAITSIVSLCLSSIVSTALVYGGFRLLCKRELSINMMHLVMLLVCLLTIIIGGCLMMIVSKSISEPIITITKGVEKIAHGDFETILELKRMDEIGQLASNYNRMVQELKSMEYMNKEFIHNVSHEMKTPVAVISGFAESLQDERLSEEKRHQYSKQLYEETRRLSHLCENMLRLTRLDNQQILANRTTFHLDEQIRRGIILLTEKWEHKNIHYDLDLIDCMITTDYELLYQVWINILDNAIKFSHDGGIVKVQMKPLPDSKVMVEITDYGAGIERDKINKIFERFYQCEESHGKDGYGLGLSIVKRIVELCNGTVSCNSIQNQRTTFHVTLNCE